MDNKTSTTTPIIIIENDTNNNDDGNNNNNNNLVVKKKKKSRIVVAVSTKTIVHRKAATTTFSKQQLSIKNHARRPGGTAAAARPGPTGIVSFAVMTTSNNNNKRRRNTTRQTLGRKSFGLPTFQIRHNNNNDTIEETKIIGTGNNNWSSEKIDSYNEEVQEGRHHTDDENDENDHEIPSDTLMAIHSLIQSDEGLHIPLSNTVQNRGSVTIQAVLQHQVMGKFVDNHATTINNEMVELFRTNKVRRLFCHDMCTSAAIILTDDYIRAAWDAYYDSQYHQEEEQQQQQSVDSTTITTTTTTTATKTTLPTSSQTLPGVGTRTTPSSSEKVLTWFLSNLHHWTGETITTSSLQRRWEVDDGIGGGGGCGGNNNTTDRTESSDTTLGISSTTTIQNNFQILPLMELLRMQLLLRDPQMTTTTTTGINDESFYLWLPQWGMVLKAWNDARKQLLQYLARSAFSVGGRFGSTTRKDGTATAANAAAKRTKEISKSNLLRQNRHSHISTHFLLNELVWKGKIRIVERPSGSFVQLVKDDVVGP